MFQNYFDILKYNFFQTSDIIQAVLITIAIYYIIKHSKNTRIWILIKGIIIILLLYIFSIVLSLDIIKYIFESLVSVLLIGLIILFQPEIRKALENIGNKSIKMNFKFNKNEFKERYTAESIDEIIQACKNMSQTKTGALILIEREIPLIEYEKTGIKINSDISSQLIMNIFEKNTPLHDGAMIIKNNKISAATCYLPLSNNQNIDKALGTRHRAGIGASEETDTIIIIVSEETGKISFVEKGKIKHNIQLDELRKILLQYKNTNEKKEKPSLQKKLNTVSLSVIIGFLVWSVLCLTINPITTIKIEDIPVTVKNDEVLINNDNTYEIIDGDTVDITVTGRKSEVMNLDTTDFIATADFNNISISNAILIDVKTDKEDLVINTNNQLMHISMDEAVTVDCPVEIIKEGVEENGYYVYSLTSKTNTIKITGPKNKIKTLDVAKAVVNIDNLNQDEIKEIKLIIYDKNGNIMNLSNCTLSTDKIDVKCKVYRTKEVPINIILQDDTTKNLSAEIISQTLSTEIVTIACSDTAFDNIESFDLKLNLKDFDLSTSKINTIIDLSNYTYNNIYIASQDSELEINLDLKIYKTKEIEIKNTDIVILNNQKCEFVDSSVIVNVKYDLSKIEDLKVSYLEPKIDIKNIDEEGYVILNFKSDTAFEILNEPKIKVKVGEE